MVEVLGYGLIGCGAFGRFCLGEYSEMDRIAPRAVTDERLAAAESTARDHGVVVEPSVDALLGRDDVEIVHIATPPATHHDLALAALGAGKHVICEKPLATSVADAHEMVELARERSLILAVNLIMRYDPLCEATRQIVESGLLGSPLHAFLENYAGDEPLLPEHWFWDPDQSGGIFVEHGVHFFDLFEMWFGPGRIAGAQHGQRPASGVIEHVQCQMVHGDGVLTNHYHGFHQPARLDRQEFRIVFERGDLRLFEWVPTALALDAVASNDQLDRLSALVPNASVTRMEAFGADSRAMTGRFRTFEADGRYRLEGDTGMAKQELYGHVVRALMQDQLDAIADPVHVRRVSEANGVTSLELAVAATELATASSA